MTDTTRPIGPPPRPPVKLPTPQSANNDEDCNSNPSLVNSISSLHDAVTENSDYQWFLDYTFRDGTCQHTSVLSSISANYKGIGELSSRYDALARDLDANLAEVDMESFRAQDIHALLLAREVLPHDSFHRGEKLASITNSLLDRLDFDTSTESHFQKADDSTAASITSMSLCKSELLFSPMKEAPPGGVNVVNFSTDSLDCELPDGENLIITCRANKDNYTIAFQHDGQNNDLEEENENLLTERDEERSRRNLALLERCQRLTDKLNRSMAMSETAFTTWGRKAEQHKLTRHPSGNNNEHSQENIEENPALNGSTEASSVIKSQSLPNIYGRNKTLCGSAHSNTMSNSTMDSFTSQRKQSEGSGCMKVYDVSQNRSLCSQNSNEPMSTSTDNQSSVERIKSKQSINLVKLFMKQMSCSNDGIMGNTVDLTDERSDCWPNSSGGESSTSDARKDMRMHTSEDLSDREIALALQHAEPKITNVNAKPMFNDLIEEDENSDICERGLYATVNKQRVKRSPLRLRKQLYGSATSISSCSDAETQLRTQLPRPVCTKATSTQAQVTMCDRSMQTSSLPLSHDVKILEHSFLSKLKAVECEKPVYVLYPNYTLPELGFLKNHPNVYLQPENVTLVTEQKNGESKGKRPFSCNDIEHLRKKGISHIRDWDSLNFLLPYECKQILSEVPELRKHMKQEKLSPATGKTKLRPASCDFAGNTNVSSSSSTATQPSSGYRGSSTILTDMSCQNSPLPGNANPLFVYRYDSATSCETSSLANQRHFRRSDQSKETTPPRPPLPKSILRKSSSEKQKHPSKRYSMFEIDNIEDTAHYKNMLGDERCKRRSLQDTYTVPKKNNDIAARRLSKQFLDAAEKDAAYNDDEGVGTETSFESGKSNKKNEFEGYPFPDNLISSEELDELEEFLLKSGVVCENVEEWNDNDFEKVRCEVSKFLTMKRSTERSKKVTPPENLLRRVEDLRAKLNTPPNSPVMSTLASHRHYQSFFARSRRGFAVKNLAEITISEESEHLDEFGSPVRTKCDYDLSQKQVLISNVTDAVESLIQHFSSASSHEELVQLGNSEATPAVAKLALNALTPALYSAFRDGLKNNIDTSFGPLDNNVWSVVEATAKQGPITQSLNELVMRVNSEDVINEGLLKFNAFVLGLLNCQSVDAWVSYIRTRESVLKKHYHKNSLLYGACIGEQTCKALLDTLIACLEPLKLLPFNVDFMFEVKELHRSFKKIENEMRAASRPTTLLPTTPLTLTQRNLLKLVRSIQSSYQSSTSQSQGSVIMRNKPTREPSTPDLLNDSGKVRPSSDKMRPRSCLNPSLSSLLSECQSNSVESGDVNRRWSGIHLGSKLMLAFDRLALYDDSDECCTDSLEKKIDSEMNKGSLNSDTESGNNRSSSPETRTSNQKTPRGKFKRLQMKWERMSNVDITPTTPPSGELTSPASSKPSRIPRPVMSPVRPTLLTSPNRSTHRSIPVAMNRKIASPTRPKAQIATPVKKVNPPPPSPVSRPSRVERDSMQTRTRPLSQPYGNPNPVRCSSGQASKDSKTPPRAQSSGSRIPQQGNRKVITICHRLASESGHLSFSSGEKLKVVLEVDERYLLCCRGDRKGLVPRDTVVFA